MKRVARNIRRILPESIADSGELERRLLLPDGDLVELMLFELAHGSLRA